MITNWNKAIALLPLLALASCGEPAPIIQLTKHCKAAAERLVDTPSTIKFVQTRRSRYPEETEISVRFDAQNIYGAIIRHKLYCTYTGPQEGLVEASKYWIDSHTLSELERISTNLDIMLKEGISIN